MNFRSQIDFKIQLINILLYISKGFDRPPKRYIIYINTQAKSRPIFLYKKIKMEDYKQYIIYKNLKLSDRPQKRIVLGVIVFNN
jgi:hypothetical protein